MTEQKRLKRRVRERMETTGERYTGARRHDVRAEPEPEPDPAAEHGLPSDEAVERATGRPWTEWFALLDEWGARERPHREIARHLASEHGISGWWSQSVTVGYERARGLRAKHEQPGGFSVGVSKTVAVPAERLQAAFAELPGLTPRPTRARLTARFDRPADGSRVAAYFADKGPAKSTVSVQVERLPDAAAAERAKEEWRGLLAGLKRALEG